MLELAVTQFRPAKADPRASLDSIGEVLRRAKAEDPPPDLVLFPEASLTGYLLEGGVRENAMTARELYGRLAERYGDLPGGGAPMDVALGFFERRGPEVFNSALYAQLGGSDPGVRHVHRKVFLPTYGLFDERRFVQAGSGVEAFDTRLGRVALLVCEDLFHSLSGSLAALGGADLLLVPSASPARGPRGEDGLPGSVRHWDRVARRTAGEHGVYVAISQLAGFEGGKAFAGTSLVVDPRGRIAARAPPWEESRVRVRVDPEEVSRARHASPLLADLRERLDGLLPGGSGSSPSRAEARPGGGSAGAGEAEAGIGPGAEEGRAGGTSAGGGTEGDGGREAPAGGPAAREGDAPASGDDPRPGDLSPLEIDPALVEEWLVRFLTEEVREKRGFERVVLAVSGGVDSATAAALCVRAFGGEAVTGLYLPYRTSRPEGREHAGRLAEETGFELREMQIDEAVDGYVEQHEPGMSDRRRGNVAARQRMIVLFDQSAKLDALPVGTGNKSERLLGYFTWHADDSPPVNPLGDLFKTQVWQLARHLEIPEEIVEKPPSAGLVRGQTDEGDLGVGYREADLVLHYRLQGYSAERLEALGFDPQTVRRTDRRLEGTHWKRHLPTVAVVSDTAIGEGYLRPVDY